MNECDVLVIGGGITGAGVLRDCALRGLKAVLLEKNHLGHGTTAASTHLIHGGLRYLLYDRLTTFTTCWDSGNILRIARPLMTRLPIVWPVYRGHAHGLETVETLLEAYDPWSSMKGGRPHLRLSAEQTLRLFPAISPDGLLGAVSFDEWWVEPVDLVDANLKSAQAAGADFRAHCEASALLMEGKRVVGARAGGDEFRASLTINASGPWVDRVASLAGLRVPLRLQKGTHLVYDGAPACLPGASAIGLLLEAEDQERYVFVVFSGKQTLLGPTDLAGGEDPDRIATSPEEIRYLLASARRYFPDFPERYDRTMIGARPILAQKGSEKLLSREFEVIDHERRDGMAGFITVGGGKMSDFRLMAEDAVDMACRKLGKAVACQTAQNALDGRPPSAPFRGRPPAKPLAKFFRTHPRLRELHSLAHLGLGFARHLGRRTLGAGGEATLEDFRSHYDHHEPSPV